MESVNLSELSDEALMAEAKKQKRHILILWVIIGFMVIASIYKTYCKGFSISSISILTPLCFVPSLISIEKRKKDVQKEIQSRENQ
jgi:uncharacterized membrane protein